MARIEELASLPLFRGLSAVELEEMGSHLVEHRVRAQERIIDQGDGRDHPVYILLTGAVEITKTGVQSRSHVIGSLAAPSVFGEVETLARRPAIASVVATTDCQLALLHRDVFDELVRRGGSTILKVIANLAATLSYRLAATDERLAAYFDLADSAAEERLGALRGVIYSGWDQA